MVRRALAWLALPIASAPLWAEEPARKQAPVVYAGGVVNAAGFVPAPDNFVAPLSIISIFGDDLSLRTASAGLTSAGRLPDSLAGVQVTINRLVIPLFYVSPTQINAQVPWAIQPRERPWEIQIVREGLASPIAAEVHVRQAAPGLFPVFLHSDFRLVGRDPEIGARPAAPGETVIVFGSGFGETLPRVAAGSLPTGPAEIVLPSSVWVADRMLPHDAVLYVGQAPTFAGLYQVNLTLPEDLEVGDHEILVEVAGARSQPDVRVAVDR